MRFHVMVDEVVTNRKDLIIDVPEDIDSKMLDDMLNAAAKNGDSQCNFEAVCAAIGSCGIQWREVFSGYPSQNTRYKIDGPIKLDKK